MTGLVAPAPAADPVAASVGADGWFPNIALADIRAQVRLGEGVVTTERLIAAIEGAMVSAFRALKDWRTARASDGAAQLADVTTEQINGQNAAELIWQRVIRFYTAAELADLHRDVSASDDGLDRAEEKERTADDYRRLAYHAVADLISIGEEEPKPRNRVSLI